MNEATYLTRSEIQALIEQTCATLGANAQGITFKFNGRLTSTLGVANVATRVLQFSKVLYPRATPKQRHQNIVHEVCHLIAVDLAGPKGRGHGWAWKRCMVRCGLNPHRCHTVEVAKRKQRGSLEVICNCPGRVMTLSTVRANKFRAGITTYRCMRCKTPVRVTEETLRRDVMEHGISPMARMAAERSA